MSTLSRSQTPPQGWQFHQPQTNWDAPNPVANTFGQQVTNIIKHRLGNPAITAQHNLRTDPESVGNELEAYTRARLGMPDPPKSQPPVQRPQGLVAAAVDSAGKIVDGAELLLDWEEKGLPPEGIPTAYPRAHTCSDCPQNFKGDWTSLFTVPAADLIRRKIERLHDVKLSTPWDGELKVCKACLCPLRLKVWTPAQLVIDHLKPGQKEKLDPRCWILKL